MQFQSKQLLYMETITRDFTTTNKFNMCRDSEYSQEYFQPNWLAEK